MSVISGYYNRGDKLQRTLDSLRLQKYDDFEVTIFNDASTDDTRALLSAYASAYSDFPLMVRHHTENKGFVRGMIEAVASTASDYVAVQGSGDTAHPDRLRHQATILDSEPDVVAVGCWYHSVTEVSGERQPRQLNADQTTLKSLIANGPPFTHGEVMYRRSAYEAAGGYRAAFTFAQDYDLWLRMIRLGRFRTVPIYLYDRYTLRDGVSYEPSKRALQARYAILARQLAVCPEQEVIPLLARLEAEGPEMTIPLSHPELQRDLFRAAIASVAWENLDAAKQITHSYLTNRRQRQLAEAVRILFGNAAGRHLLRTFGTRK